MFPLERLDLKSRRQVWKWNPTGGGGLGKVQSRLEKFSQFSTKFSRRQESSVSTQYKTGKVQYADWEVQYTDWGVQYSTELFEAASRKFSQYPVQYTVLGRSVHRLYWEVQYRRNRFSQSTPPLQVGMVGWYAPSLMDHPARDHPG